MTAPLEAVMRSAVDGPLIGLLAPPLSPVSGVGQPGQGNRLRLQPGITSAYLPACFSD